MSVEMGSPHWYAMVYDTIDAVVREVYPRTRPHGPDNELRGNLMHHARELGADVDRLRAVLRESPEFIDNQTTTDPDPITEPIDPGEPFEPPIDGLALPIVSTPRGWGDQTGYKAILGASWFPSLRILRDSPDRFYRQLDWFASKGVRVIRSFAGVCHPNYWANHGRDVLPVRAPNVGAAWPEYEALAIQQAKAFESRGISWFLTSGDLQEFESEAEVYARPFRALSAAGLLHVVGPVDVNEMWQNSRRGNDTNHARALVKLFADAGRPWATSAHPSGDDRAYIDNQWVGVGAPVATIHGPGGTELMVRHIINHRHEEEGVGFRVALMQGEPRGPGQDVSAGAVNEASWVVLAAVAAAMTGQLYILHCSRGVRDRDNDDPWDAFAPYFERTAAVYKRIPRSRVMASAHGGRGGTMPNALFASTRPDGKFHGDTGVPNGSGQFHRCDAVLYESGQRACLLYGGNGDREARTVRPTSGKFYNTHGNEVRSIEAQAGAIVRFSGEQAGDGLFYVEG